MRREELGPEGQQLWDGLVSNLGDQIVTADGGLAGPFNAFVTAPGAGRRLSSLGLVESELTPPTAVTDTARPLSAPELVASEPTEEREDQRPLISSGSG